MAKVRVPSGAPGEMEALVTNSRRLRTGMPRNRDIAWRSSLSAVGQRGLRDCAPMVLEARLPRRHLLYGAAATSLLSFLSACATHRPGTAPRLTFGPMQPSTSDAVHVPPEYE